MALQVSSSPQSIARPASDAGLNDSTAPGRCAAANPQTVGLSLSLCVLSQQSAWSQDGAAPLRNAARPCGFFSHCPQPERQVEPNAGRWKTWLLSDVSQVRPPGPPSRAISEKEIRVLKRLSFQRDAAALDLINFWDAGAPSFRWNEFATDRIRTPAGILPLSAVIFFELFRPRGITARAGFSRN